jgi:photosystem I reaction center subunit VIII|tara:strand:- start:1352 stop:1510 length:159 start_codon:yes stop_codon:yes gene_type:complete
MFRLFKLRKSKSKKKIMTASFLPSILTPVVTLVFPGMCFALFFVLIEQEEVA